MSSRRLSRRGSSSPRARSSSTPKRSSTAVSPPSHNASRCVTSSSVGLPSVGASPPSLPAHPSLPQADSIPRFRGRSAAYGVLRFVMESGAKGCEVVISGKLRAARAKSMKFTDGFMIHSGQPARDFVDEAVRHVMLRQGVLGIKVKMCVAPFFPVVFANARVITSY